MEQDLSSVVLVGRDRELQRMLALLDAAAPGRPIALVVEGPPASGRSRLLDEFARAARRRGVTVVFETEWARAGAGTRPSLFVSDHLARLDPRVWPAVELRAESVPVMVAVTGRAGADPLPVDGWARVHRVRLTALAPGEIAQLAGILLGAQPGAELLELCRAAAGRPGAVRELITGLREEGLVKVVAGRASLGTVRLPGRTRARLLNQLAALSPQGRHLVQAATTLRSPFPLIRLTRLLQAGPVALIPAIDEVLESGLLIGDNEMLRFAHDLVRAVVESTIPPPVMAALRHGQPAPVRRARPQPVVARVAGDWSLLTAREREIAELAAQALTNQQIAGRLGRTTHTVNYHLRQIFQKLGLTSRVELAALVPAGKPANEPAESRTARTRTTDCQNPRHQAADHQHPEHRRAPRNRGGGATGP